MFISLTLPSILGAAVWSAAVAAGSIGIYLRLPARWLCEYGEVPGAAQEPAGRCGGSPSGRLARAAAAGAATLVCLVLPALVISRLPALQLVTGASDAPAVGSPGPAQLILLTVILICLTLAALSDLDYMIIPDQVAAALFLLALARAVLPAADAAFAAIWMQIDPASATSLSGLPTQTAQTSDAAFAGIWMQIAPASDVTFTSLSTQAAQASEAAISVLSEQAIPTSNASLTSLSAQAAPSSDATLASLSAQAAPSSDLLSQAASELADGLVSCLAGAALVGGLMLLAALPSRLIYGSGALGTGDIKLLAACGAVVGVSRALELYVLTVFSSALFMAAGLLTRRFTLHSAHPMAPWIAAVTVICLQVG